MEKNSKKYGYARVSSKQQNLDRQLVELGKHIADARDIITDHESGKDFDRPGYKYLKEVLLRPGDVLLVKSIDRLGRNKDAIKAELAEYKTRGVRVQVLDIPTTMTAWPDGQEWVGDMVNQILIEVLSSLAEQERRNIRQRQAEGIAVAKAQGRALGRRKTAKPDGWDEVVARWRRGEISAVRAMEELGLRKTTFYKLTREAE